MGSFDSLVLGFLGFVIVWGSPPLEEEDTGECRLFLVFNTKAKKFCPSFRFVVCRPQIRRSWEGELAAERGVLWTSENVPSLETRDTLLIRVLSQRLSR